MCWLNNPRRSRASLRREARRHVDGVFAGTANTEGIGGAGLS